MKKEDKLFIKLLLLKQKLTNIEHNEYNKKNKKFNSFIIIGIIFITTTIIILKSYHYIN